MKRHYLLLVFPALAVVVFASCQLAGSGTSSPSTSTALNVYIGGSVGTSASALAPVYWKDGTLTQLPMGSNDTYGTAGGTAADGSGNIFIAGSAGTSSSTPVPVYWKNGVPTTLSVGASGPTGLLNSVTVDSSGIVYAAGSVGTSTTTQVPAYWVNTGVPYLPSMDSGDSSGSVWGPSVYSNSIGTTVYYVGYEANGTTSQTPVYWDDTGAGAMGPNHLTTGSGDTFAQALAVTVDTSGNVYVAGSEGTSSSAQAPIYWINNTIYPLSTGNNSGGAALAAVLDASGYPYFAGYVGSSTAQVPSYWHNSLLMSLPVGSGNTVGEATGVALDSSGNLYVSGWVGTSTVEKPAYWKNGTLTLLPMSGSDSYGYAGGVAFGN